MAEAKTVISQDEFKAMSPEGKLRVRVLCAIGEWKITDDKKPVQEV